MNNNMKLALKYILMLVLIFVALRFFIVIFPFLLLFMIGYIVYDQVKRNINTGTDKKSNKKQVKDNIQEAEVIRERKDN